MGDKEGNDADASLLSGGRSKEGVRTRPSRPAPAPPPKSASDTSLHERNKSPPDNAAPTIVVPSPSTTPTKLKAKPMKKKKSGTTVHRTPGWTPSSGERPRGSDIVVHRSKPSNGHSVDSAIASMKRSRSTDEIPVGSYSLSVFHRSPNKSKHPLNKVPEIGETQSAPSSPIISSSIRSALTHSSPQSTPSSPVPSSISTSTKSTKQISPRPPAAVANMFKGRVVHKKEDKPQLLVTPASPAHSPPMFHNAAAVSTNASSLLGNESKSNTITTKNCDDSDSSEESHSYIGGSPSGGRRNKKSSKVWTRNCSLSANLSINELKFLRQARQLIEMQPDVQTQQSLLLRVGDYYVHSIIGSGSSGNVYLGSHGVTDEKVAIKIIKLNRQDDDDVESWGSGFGAGDVPTLSGFPRRQNLGSGRNKGLVEFSVLRNLPQHKHICRLIEAKRNDNVICLVLQYAGNGDLHKYMTERGRVRREGQGNSGVRGMGEEISRRLFCQLIAAVRHLHMNGYVHRDIRPENILLDKENNVLLCDFSLAGTWDPLQPTNLVCGTLHYSSPEVLFGAHYVGPEIDMWSCGAVLYYLLTGMDPFGLSKGDRVLADIRAGRYTPLPNVVSAEAHHLVSRMLEVNPLKRITMMDLYKHPWVTSGKGGSVIIGPGSVDPTSAAGLIYSGGRSHAPVSENGTIHGSLILGASQSGVETKNKNRSQTMDQIESGSTIVNSTTDSGKKRIVLRGPEGMRARKAARKDREKKGSRKKDQTVSKDGGVASPSEVKRKKKSKTKSEENPDGSTRSPRKKKKKTKKEDNPEETEGPSIDSNAITEGGEGNGTEDGTGVEGTDKWVNNFRNKLVRTPADAKPSYRASGLRSIEE